MKSRQTSDSLILKNNRYWSVVQKIMYMQRLENYFLKT